MEPSEEIDDAQLEAIRARLDEPPPVISLASRNHGLTPLVEYLALLREDRIKLVDEIDRLRAEINGPIGPTGPQAQDG
jgi:hypothetical protein